MFHTFSRNRENLRLGSWYNRYMPKLGYIVGFSALFLVLSTVGAASVVGLRGTENQGDPSSVGNRGSFGNVTDAQAAIAQTARKIAEKTQGRTDSPAYLQEYIGLIRTHLKLDASVDPEKCTPCNYFAIVVMRESGADSNFPHLNAQEQYLEYLYANDGYQKFAIKEDVKGECKVGNLIDIPKAGDLLYEIRSGGVPGHVGIDIGNNEVASASIGKRSPRISVGTAKNFDCGVRLVATP